MLLHVQLSDLVGPSARGYVLFRASRQASHSWRIF